MNDMTQTPGIGHNNPPDMLTPADQLGELATAKERARSALEAAKAWEGIEVATEEQSGRLTDMIARLKGVHDTTDGERLELTKPLRERQAAINAAYKPVLDALENRRKGLLAQQKAWLDKLREQKRAAEEAERKRLAEEKRALEQEAAKARDEIAKAEAEKRKVELAAQEKELEKQAKANATAKSGSGAGRTLAVRKRRRAMLVKGGLAEAFLALQNDPRVAEVLTTIANERVRSKDYDGHGVPGFDIIEEEILQ